jgi:hypothetical protein
MSPRPAGPSRRTLLRDGAWLAAFAAVGLPVRAAPAAAHDLVLPAGPIEDALRALGAVPASWPITSTTARWCR